MAVLQAPLIVAGALFTCGAIAAIVGRPKLVKSLCGQLNRY
jgi:hypothetical protein